MAEEILDLLVNLRDRQQPHALATVIDTEGSASAKVGAKAVIDAQGRQIAGWVGGGCAESQTRQAAMTCLERGESTIIDIDLNDEMLGAGMPCGGSMRIYIEPMLPRPTLWLMGHGRVAEVLCALADTMGLEVVVNDPGATAAEFPAARRLVVDDMAYETLTPAATDFVVIATQHKGDHESIERALQSSAHYIALIASRKRAGLVLDHLRDRGIATEQIERVRSPAGLDIAARTPEEIALSVMAEIVMIRRGGGGQVLTERVEERSAGRSGAA